MTTPFVTIPVEQHEGNLARIKELEAMVAEHEARIISLSGRITDLLVSQNYRDSN